MSMSRSRAEAASAARAEGRRSRLRRALADFSRASSSIARCSAIEAKIMASLTQQQFTVPDMDCQSCVSSITAAVQRLDGRAIIAADLKTKHVVVGSKAEAHEIMHAIEGAGFTVKAA